MARLQGGMLFHQELDPESAAYHDVLSYHLRAPLDPDLLRQALAAVIASHPVLRTSLHLGGFGEPLQLVHGAVAVPLTIVDISPLPAAEQEREVDAWMEAERGRRFDPRQAPLLRFHLQIRGADRFQFSWSCHHAILDGWSAAAMLAEVFQRYLRALGENEKAAIYTGLPVRTVRLVAGAGKPANLDDLLELMLVENLSAQDEWAESLRLRIVESFERASQAQEKAAASSG